MVPILVKSYGDLFSTHSSLLMATTTAETTTRYKNEDDNNRDNIGEVVYFFVFYS